MATFSGVNWVPVRNAALVRPGSIIWHRYSSVPPSGGAGVYASAIFRSTNRSPARSGCGGADDPPACALCDPVEAGAELLSASDPQATTANAVANAMVAAPNLRSGLSSFVIA
ncbi:hypothetical protein GCM10029963_48590 [Micromonospora andamanensis]